MSFDLSQCQQIDQNMCECSAIDKPIGNPNSAAGWNQQCARVGKKENVYVTQIID
jgi:hypothetical protein